MSSFTEELEYERVDGHRYWNPLYKVTKSFTYHVGDIKEPIASFTVPAGYVTDLASIPFFLHWLFRPDGKWAKAAALHDYLYDQHKEVSKEIADAIFLEAMLVTKVGPFTAHLFFIIVRIVQTLKDKGFDIGY